MGLGNNLPLNLNDSEFYRKRMADMQNQMIGQYQQQQYQNGLGQIQAHNGLLNQLAYGHGGTVGVAIGLPQAQPTKQRDPREVKLKAMGYEFDIHTKSWIKGTDRVSYHALQDGYEPMTNIEWLDHRVNEMRVKLN